jgi:nuclease S1
MLTSFVFTLLFGGATLHTTLPVRGWWDLGHRIVARLADLRLTAHTRDAVREILNGQRMDDASVWADDIKNYRHDADPLHYVNIPLQTSIYVPSRHCPKGLCIIAAIEHDRRVLADPRAGRENKADALRFLIHFMGDLHQPLHDADNADRGGNQRLVNFLGHDTNLHKVWDGELIDSSGVDQESYFAYLRARMDSLDVTSLERGTVVEWAMEGHRIAVEDAYGRIPANGHLGRGYLEANRPVIDKQLIAAGVRLAKVLNEALAAYRVR